MHIRSSEKYSKDETRDAKAKVTGTHYIIFASDFVGVSDHKFLCSIKVMNIVIVIELQVILASLKPFLETAPALPKIRERGCPHPYDKVLCRNNSAQTGTYHRSYQATECLPNFLSPQYS